MSSQSWRIIIARIAKSAGVVEMLRNGCKMIACCVTAADSITWQDLLQGVACLAARFLEDAATSCNKSQQVHERATFDVNRTGCTLL